LREEKRQTTGNGVFFPLPDLFPNSIPILPSEGGCVALSPSFTRDKAESTSEINLLIFVTASLKDEKNLFHQSHLD
jgi:hypothetical protein